MIINLKGHNIFAFSDTHGMYRRLSIPADVDFLITHGPAYSYLDRDLGCKNLFLAVARATAFRIWATGILKEYIKKGFVAARGRVNGRGPTSGCEGWSEAEPGRYEFAPEDGAKASERSFSGANWL